MAARFSYANMDPQKLPVKLYEGHVDIADAFGPDGLKVEDAVSYDAEIQKGDLVKFYSDSGSSGEVVVEKVTLGTNEVNDAVGIVIDTPFGNDNTTVTTYTPTHALRRSATIRCFGTQIEEFPVTSAGNIRAQYSALYSEAAEGVIEGSATLANGDMVIMAYAAASAASVPVLMGYNGFHPAD